MSAIITESPIDLFRPVDRPPGSYPKTGAMSGLATIHTLTSGRDRFRPLAV
jgi:hypothetical protein